MQSCHQMNAYEDTDNNFSGDGEVMMQFTGRKDVNNVEVYEGDVIKNNDKEDLQVVYWNKDKAAWYCRYIEDEKHIVSLYDSLGNLNDVIGNVFENPDLLQLNPNQNGNKHL